MSNDTLYKRVVRAIKGRGNEIDDLHRQVDEEQEILNVASSELANHLRDHNIVVVDRKQRRR